MGSATVGRETPGAGENSLEADLESDLRLPIVTIDGRGFGWQQLGHMLMTFEGFNLELRVRHRIEVVGGPLLDEE